MSEERIEIRFAIKSKEFADLIRTYSSETMHNSDEGEERDIVFNSFDDADYDGTFYTDNDITIGSLNGSEYDEMWDGWRPKKPIPGGKNVIDWIIDVICNGDYQNDITEEGKAYIRNNSELLEKSLQKYKIMYFNCPLHGESSIHYEKFDGDCWTTYKMYPDNWDSMWNSDNKSAAQAVFEKHGLTINSYKVSESFIGDIFASLKDSPVFIELLELFADKKTEEKRTDDEAGRLQDEINELLGIIGQWVADPKTISYEGKKVGKNIYANNMLKPYTDWGERMKIRFFVESSLEQLGATLGSNFAAKTDISVLIRNSEDYSTDYEICKYFNIDSLNTVTHNLTEGGYTEQMNITDKEYHIGKLAVFRDYLERCIEEYKESNEKRVSKKTPMSAMQVVFEDELFSYLMELDNNADYNESRKRIAKNMVEQSPYVGGDPGRMESIYNAKPEGRDFEL